MKELAVAAGDLAPSGSSDDICNILRTVRVNLGMDVAFIGEFVEDSRVFRHVDGERPVLPIRQGQASSLKDSYCARVVDGRLPELIPDTRQSPEALSLPGTHALPVGSHISVPIRLSDGSLYGTFCCFSHAPDPGLGLRDLNMLRAFADIAAKRIDHDHHAARVRTARNAEVRSVLDAGGPGIVYQPIFLIDELRIVGAEALARFAAEPRRPPDEWFAAAGEADLKVDLELAAIRNALARYRDVWREHPIQLDVNASPDAVVDARFAGLFDDYPSDRIVIELTEHDQVRDYAPLVAELSCLRSMGMKIAIDDVGAGYASMRHILAIRPDIMKLDVGIVRSIDTDEMKLALASSLVTFAAQFGCKVVAEGVETEAELDVLRRLEVPAAQGFLLARPEPVTALRGRLQRF